MKEGDNGCKYFYNIISANHKKELIECAQVNGNLNNDPSYMKESFYSFYKDLFTSEFNDTKKQELDNCLKLIPKKISNKDEFVISLIIKDRETTKIDKDRNRVVVQESGQRDKNQIIMIIRNNREEFSIEEETVKPRVDSRLTFLEIAPSKP